MTEQMIQIQAYNPPDFFRTSPEDAAQKARSWLQEISSLSSCGVYIIRSISHPETYRLGMFAKGALRRLVTDHLGQAVPENHVYPNGKRPNSTQIKRPFIPVWFCVLPGATHVATKLAENILEFTVGEKHKLSEQKSEGSMFTPSSEFDQDLANIATDFKARLAGCYKQLQIAVNVLPDFPPVSEKLRPG